MAFISGVDLNGPSSCTYQEPQQPDIIGEGREHLHPSCQDNEVNCIPETRYNTLNNRNFNVNRGCGVEGEHDHKLGQRLHYSNGLPSQQKNFLPSLTQQSRLQRDPSLPQSALHLDPGKEWPSFAGLCSIPTEQQHPTPERTRGGKNGAKFFFNVSGILMVHILVAKGEMLQSINAERSSSHSHPVPLIVIGIGVGRVLIHFF